MSANWQIKGRMTRLLAARESGAIERCHVIPHQGSYSNATHSYGVAVLCYLLWPARHQLLQAALFHDVPERWSGDIPAQFILARPEVRSNLTQFDVGVFRGLQLPSIFELSPMDVQRLKAADKLDLWLWCLEQRRVGNMNVLGCLDQLDRIFKTTGLPEEAQAVVDYVNENGYGRLPELFSELFGGASKNERQVEGPASQDQSGLPAGAGE